ncbi:MAG: phosphonate C-P lyase system protein PhnK [Thermodesulfobacteriota bacterium]|nr:phosphonate C-P lyase system protein PhnK [Thermodesulfobacteriota bacterium]
MRAEQVSKYYGPRAGCRDVDFTLWQGEVLGIVGESGSGKSTLLNCLSGLAAPSSGHVYFYSRQGRVDFCNIPEAEKRSIIRSELGIVHQNARDGLRMDISAGGNIGESLLAGGARHYGEIRQKAAHWLDRVEIGSGRIDDRPRTFSGGMQQRLQIARNLVTNPRLIFMDEPTSGLDVSVQARLLDILRTLVRELALSLVIVTHDLAVARLLAHRLMVMKEGRVVESGLTDQILDDPQQAYTQLLVASVLRI